MRCTWSWSSTRPTSWRRQRSTTWSVAFPTPLGFGYAGPAFSAAFLDTCSISAWADVGALAGGRGASAQIEEGVSPGIGLITFFDGLRSNYVQHSCQRRAAGAEYLYSPALTVRTRSYDVDGASAAALAFERELGASDTAEVIGDESVVSAGGRRPVVLFRRGSVVIEVEYYPGDEVPPSDPVAVLLPMARAIDARAAR